MASRGLTTSLGRMVRGARIEQALTLRDIGLAIRRQPSFVSELELGKRLVSRRLLDDVVKACGLAPATAVQVWLDERCRLDPVLSKARAPLTFMQACRRRRFELGMTATAVARAARVSSMADLEFGRRLPPKNEAARRLLAVLGLPASLAAQAKAERIAHRRALLLPTTVTAAARRRARRLVQSEGR